MKAKLLLLLAILPVASVVAECVQSQLELFSRNNKLEFPNGDEFKLKGLNWFGFETNLYIVHGLWAQDVDYFLNFITEHKFNAVRIPLSVDVVLEDPLPPSYDFLTCQFDGTITSLQALDFLIARFAERGVLVLLDQHRLDDANISPCYTDATHPESMIIEFWDKLINRYEDSWNVMGVDLKNEPYGCEWRDWASFAERMGDHILQQVPRWLIFVNGIGSDPGELAQDRCLNYSPCSENTFWGENLMGACNRPITLSNQEKLVYSPHVYGPSVYRQDYFSDVSFPDNMPNIWNCHFGYLQDNTTHAVVVGEWGGEYTDSKRKKDKTWQDAYAAWAFNRGLAGSFYWCLNKNSGDTGGLLAGQKWQRPETEKLALLEFLQSNPTNINATSSSSSGLVEYCYQDWDSLVEAPVYVPWPCSSTGCGDGSCDAGEDQCSCAMDCGPPASNETSCSDEKDNDCNGDIDCDDANCFSDPACQNPPGACNNDGICDSGEDCNNCSDCEGRSNGPDRFRYCCGDGIKDEREGDGSICDGNY